MVPSYGSSWRHFRRRSPREPPPGVVLNSRTACPWPADEESAFWDLALVPTPREATGRRIPVAKSSMSGDGLVSRVTPVHTALRNCTRDEGRPFEFGNQVLISSHRKLLSSNAMVVNVAEKSGHDPDRQG